MIIFRWHSWPATSVYCDLKYYIYIKMQICQNQFVMAKTIFKVSSGERHSSWHDLQIWGIRSVSNEGADAEMENKQNNRCNLVLKVIYIQKQKIHLRKKQTVRESESFFSSFLTRKAQTVEWKKRQSILNKSIEIWFCVGVRLSWLQAFFIALPLPLQNQNTTEYRGQPFFFVINITLSVGWKTQVISTHATQKTIQCRYANCFPMFYNVFNTKLGHRLCPNVFKTNNLYFPPNSCYRLKNLWMTTLPT